MAQDVVKYACPYCEEQFRELNALKSHLEKAHSPKAAPPVWGREVYPPPKGTAFIDSDVMKCVGCGLCAAFAVCGSGRSFYWSVLSSGWAIPLSVHRSRL